MAVGNIQQGEAATPARNKVNAAIDEVNKTIRFANRAAFVAYVAANSNVDAGSVASDGRHQYVATPGATFIPDLQGWLPLGPVITPQHWGAVADGTNDDTAAIQSAWDYWLTRTAIQGSQNPANGQLPFYFPAGRYVSTAGLVLTTSTTGAAIYGDGAASVLDKIDFRLDGAVECQITDMRLIGASTNGIELASAANGCLISRVDIRDKDNGILHTNSVQAKVSDSEISKCGINVNVDDPSGDSYSNVNSTSARDYCWYLNGAAGELKLNGCRGTGAGLSNTSGSWANMYIYGDNNETSVECYFSGVTLTTALAGSSDRRFPITSIVNNGSGKIRITTTSPAEVFTGFADLDIAGTTNYNGQALSVLEVISPTVIDVDVDYVSDEAAGEVQLEGWDLIVEAANAVQNVNDMYFSAGNINYTKIDGGFNVNFIGTRPKQQIWIGDTNDSNRVFFVRNARGRNDVTQSDLPICGPGSDAGWAELAWLDETPAWAPNGGEKLALRMPHAASGVGSNNEPVNINEVAVFADKVSTTVAGSTMTLADSNGDLVATLPGNGRFEASNTAKAYGTVRWIANVPTLVYGYNISSITNETASETGRCTLLFDRDFASDDQVVPVVSPISSNDGAAQILGLVEDGRMKVEGKINGADAEVDFTFVVYGELA